MLRKRHAIKLKFVTFRSICKMTKKPFLTIFFLPRGWEFWTSENSRCSSSAQKNYCINESAEWAAEKLAQNAGSLIQTDSNLVIFHTAYWYVLITRNYSPHSMYVYPSIDQYNALSTFVQTGYLFNNAIVNNAHKPFQLDWFQQFCLAIFPSHFSK